MQSSLSQSMKIFSGTMAYDPEVPKWTKYSFISSITSSFSDCKGSIVSCTMISSAFRRAGDSGPDRGDEVFGPEVGSSIAFTWGE